MRSEVSMIIEWEPSQGSDGSDVQTLDDLVGYVMSTIESNAHFEHLPLAVVNVGGRELEDDEDYE